VEALGWTVSLILGIPSALLIVCNWGGIISASRAGRSYSFTPPYLCGVVGAVAWLVCPVPQVRSWAWAPLVLDPSIGLLFLAIALHGVARLTGWRSPFDPKR
jgi:hypothetical protein